MGAWTFQVFSEPFVLDPDEQRDVIAEITRLRVLIGGAGVRGRVQVTRNPAGLAGEYASMLIDATVRGCAVEEIVPELTRQRYRGCHWFDVCQEVLAAFRQEWEAVRQEAGMLEPMHRS